PEGGLAWDAGQAGAADQAGAAELAAWDAADQETAERAGVILAADGDAGPPRVSFVYLGAVDFAGHVTGAGDAYRTALRAADQRVGRLLDAVRSSSREPWTVVVV